MPVYKLTKSIAHAEAKRKKNRDNSALPRQVQSMRHNGHIHAMPDELARPFHVEEPERLSAPMQLLVRLYYDAGRNPEALEEVLERLGSSEKGVAGDLRQRILEDLAELRGTPWLPEPRSRAHGSAYGNTR